MHAVGLRRVTKGGIIKGGITVVSFPAKINSCSYEETIFSSCEPRFALRTVSSQKYALHSTRVCSRKKYLFNDTFWQQRYLLISVYQNKIFS